MIQELTVIGAMSGTSLDGLDLCAVQFKKENGIYSYEIIATETFAYDNVWVKKLQMAYKLEHAELGPIHTEYGQYTAKLIQNFILKNQLSSNIDLIGSHGQTIFHQPEEGITIQIGDGAEIAKKTKVPTISNFRVKDVSLGGQGAPLVPIGDKLLFSQYASCLNLGGIANISFEKNEKRIAFDIAPANLPLNKLVAEKFNIPYDKNGEIASSGKVIQELLDQLNQLDYYQQAPPKSLGYEWLDAAFYPLIAQFKDASTANLLATIVAHETEQVAKVLNSNRLSSCLVTGGGALNSFWMSQLCAKTDSQIILPDLETINFKEALIFAFLAYLNHFKEINTLASVTGAKSDSIGGELDTPPL